MASAALPAFLYGLAPRKTARKGRDRDTEIAALVELNHDGISAHSFIPT
jgi:hypothetical protein